MDVRCNRCGTDYEFDDDLISDRGTTVQCTNCGYQFKIYPERTAVMSPERWVVHTMAGRELAYTSLRDLQRAISENKVGPKDLLSRGNQAPRALGSIPELEPFFATTAGQSRGMQTAPRTMQGVAPPPSGTPRPPAEAKKIQPTKRGFGLPSDVGFASTLPSAAAKTGDFAQQPAASRILGADPSASTEPAPPRAESAPPKPAVPTPSGAPKMGMASTQRSGTLPDPAREIVHVKAVRVASDPPPKAFEATLPAASPPAPRIHTDPGIGAAAPPNVAPRDTRPGPPPKGPLNLDATLPVPAEPGGFAPIAATQRMVSERAAANFAAASGPGSSPYSTGPVRSSPRAAPTPEPPPISTRDRVPSYDELPLEEHVDPARRARSRWIAGVVFLAVAGLLGATLGRQYLVRLSTGQKAEPARHDERTARFLQEGTRLLDQADYDGAQAEFAKAQALSDRDPGVLAALGRLETVRADLVWLKLRLLDPTAQDNVQATTRELTRRAGRARQAVDAAFAVVADDPVVVRSRIDAMRIAGEEAKAREWIAPIAANASDPQNAYVLAALDLSETAPAFSTVIDRLRAAAVSEHEALRARGALIYALVRAGRVLEAETELAKVTAGERAHPLAPELKAFVGRFSAGLDGGVPAPPTSASASAAPAAPAPSERATGGAATGGGVAPITGDFRSRLTQASQASARGELTRAEDLYQSVLSEQPGNTEALSGLADVARRRGDSATASRLYERVLDSNPSYLPALMAVADTKWASGDHAGAVSYYRRVLEQAGPSSDYGHRAQSRINDAEGGNKAAPSAPAAPKPDGTEAPAPASPPTGDNPAPSRPDIDTTDLPGVKPP